MTQRSNKGFTIIELTLAMTFVSLMLHAIAMTVIQISNIYNRGITLRQVNQASRAIAEDMQRTIAASASFSLEHNYIKQSWGGRLCMGQYSYIWNTADTLALPSLNASNSNIYTEGTERIRFVRVPDSGAMYCADPARTINRTEAVEFLMMGDRPLAIHGFDISSSVESSLTGQRLYTTQITLGTDDIGSIEPVGKVCRPPADEDSNTLYCAVNQFMFTSRAGLR